MEKGKEINQNEERKKGKKKTLYSDYYKSPFAVRLRYLMGFNEETKKSKIREKSVQLFGSVELYNYLCR